ncbi:Uncharacterized protein PBTT_00028 [Plasmodiophora brassicae]|nr:hypothetical protein PBRA_008919 [Plasmodiophora brassicae]
MTNPIRLHVDSTCHTAAQLSTGPRKRDALTRLIQNLLGRRQATRGVSVDMTDPARPSSSSEAAPRREYKPVGNPFARETLSHAGRHGWRCGRDNDATVDIIEHEADILTLSRDMFRVGQVTGTLPNQPLRADLRCRANGTAHAQRAISKADVNDGLTICAPITSRKDDTTGGCTYAPTMLDETGPLYRRLRMPRKSVSGITGDDLVDAGRQAGGIRGGQRATNVKRFPPKAVGSGLIRGPAKQSDVTTVGNPSPTSLTRAIRNGSIADVRRNVQAGVTWRCAHVRLASRGGHLAIVQYLVAQIKDESVRRKVIQVAIEAAQDERVRSLLIKHNRSRHIE